MSKSRYLELNVHTLYRAEKYVLHYSVGEKMQESAVFFTFLRVSP
jgi:hypothetical protein